MSENLSQYPSSGLQHHSSSYGAAPAAVPELLDQALALHRGNRLVEAVALYREVLALAPDHFQACFNLGAICHAGGDLSGAISSYRQVLQLTPDNFQALYFLAKALSDQGCREEAIVTYQQAIGGGSGTCRRPLQSRHPSLPPG